MILVRSLAHRAGTTLALLLVALASVAAATAGPTYNAAARQSILRDSIVSAPLLGRTLEVDGYGSVVSVLPQLQSFTEHRLYELAGGATDANRIFGPTATSLETQTYVGRPDTSTTLAWFTEACRDVVLASGQCPTAAKQVMVSSAFAKLFHFQVGQRLKSIAGLITISGIYAPPNADSPVWYDRGNGWFPMEIPCPTGNCSRSTNDVMFTAPATFTGLKATTQGQAKIDRPLVANHVKASDLDTLQRINDNFFGFGANGYAVQISAQTNLGQTVSTVRTSWRKLSVPIAVVTAEVLVLVWILMFVLVVDSNEARASEVALAKLRGFSRLRMLRFALGEPVTIVLLAFPVGTVLGWLAAKSLAAHQLRAGTAVHFVAIGWLFGALATLGGLVPVIGGARGIVRRSVIEQWRRTPQQGGRRGWVLDAVIGTAALIGLAQLVAGGHLDTSSKSPVALLVPALLGIAVAITSSRLLPLICRSLYARTRDRGGLGTFLAVRHIGRRPTAMRTMVILSTAMALATFGISSWSVGHANRVKVAQLTVGAPTVLTVNPNLGVDVGAAVERADPSGTRAVAVQRVSEGGPITLAVQLSRFAAVAHWGASGVGNARSLLSKLNSSSPPPVVLKGDRVRVSYSIAKVSQNGSSLNLNVVPTGANASIPLSLGTFAGKFGSRTSTIHVPSEDSTVVGFELDPPPQDARNGVVISGVVTIHRIQLHTRAGWTDVPGVMDPRRWAVENSQAADVQAASGNGGLRWTINVNRGAAPMLNVIDRPASLPAIAASAVSAGFGSFNVIGLDGTNLSVSPVTRLSGIPGAPNAGVVVNLEDADRASYGVATAAVPQVWVRGDPAPIEAALRKAGVSTISALSSGDRTALYSRQGPGLASAIFATDAVAAAILAAFGAILSLAVAARRRRHEYAAMNTAGVSRRSLYAAMAIEQLVITGVAAIVGAIAGVVATVLIERDIPEFLTNPSGIRLHHTPSVAIVALTAGAGVGLLLAVVAIGVWILMRSIDPERLRAAAP